MPAWVESGPEGLAPAWHTAALIAVIVVVAVVGTALGYGGVPVAVTVAPASQTLVLYAQVLAVAWGLLFYVCRVGRARSALGSLIGKGWTSAGRAAVDVVLAVALALLIVAAETAFRRVFGASPSSAVAAMLPRTPVARAAWAAVAVSVGLSEEVVYRGYLQTQLVALTGRTTVACLLQACLFGLAHAEQGTTAMARIAIYGLALGALARCRKSLLPGIVCHIGIDLASGLQ